MCDLVYAHFIDLLERRVATQQTIAGFAMAMGGEDVEIPDPEKLRAEFDAELRAEPKHMSRDEWELRKALGVGV